jgi:starch synthase
MGLQSQGKTEVLVNSNLNPISAGSPSRDEIKGRMHYRVSLSSIGRFHFFALAVELAKAEVLQKIYTGYPKRMARKAGIPDKNIESFPWLVTPMMASPRFIWPSELASRAYNNLSHDVHDRWVAASIRECDIFHGLSRYNLRAGIRAKQLGAIYICEVGSAHILEQVNILTEAHDRVGLKWNHIHPQGIERELREYEEADKISVLSSFAMRSFIKHGIPESKLICTPPGVNLKRFGPPEIKEKKGIFRVLFVGQITIRKGVHLLAEAFKKAKLPNSELVLAGGISKPTKALIDEMNVPNLQFLGPVPNAELASVYSTASVFVMPSLEDGFGMVALEAMACGCPVIISSNAGAADLVNEGVNGYVVPAGDVDAIVERLEQLYRDSSLAEEMGRQASELVRRDMSWARYGETMTATYQRLLREKDLADSAGASISPAT